MSEPSTSLTKPHKGPLPPKHRKRISHRVFSNRNAPQISVKYNPLPHQKQFGDMLASGKRVVLLLGGRRGGKTYAGAFESVKQIYAHCRQPNLGWIVSPTYPMSLVTERAFENAAGYADTGGLILRKFRGDRAYLLYPNKLSSEPYRVEVKSGENPDRLRGPGLGWIWIDEAAMITEECWKILLGCVLDTRGVIFLTTTPRGHNWLYEKVYKESLRNPAYGAVKAGSLANTTLDPEEVRALRSQYSTTFARQELDAEFVAFEGLVYRAFDYSRHAVDALTEFPDRAEMIGGVDFGWDDPFVHLWVLKHDNKFYVVDEYYAKSRTMESHARAVKGARWDKYVIRRWADPTAAQASGDLQNYGIGTYPARNDLKAGIDCVARLFEQGRLYVAKTCLNTMKELSEYHYEAREGHNSGDKPVDFANHTMDALRYALYSETNFSQAHPWMVLREDGSLEVQDQGVDPLSNRLSDWIRLPSSPYPVHEITPEYD